MSKNVIEVVIDGVDKASGPLGKVSGALGSFVGTAAKMAAGAAAAGTAVFAFTAKIADMQDKVAKTAKQLGLGADELSKWQKVADYAGVGTEDFNNSLRFLQRATAEAAEGTSLYAENFRKLGINAKEFKNLSLEEQMKTLNTSFAGVTDQTEKMNIAMGLMSRGGGKMLQMLDGNNEAMDELAKRTEYLGGVLDTKAAANAEVFMDRLGEVQTAIGGTSRAIADKLVPLFTGVMKHVADVIAEWREPLAEFTETAILRVVQFGVILTQVFDKIKSFLSTVFTVEGFNNFISAAGDAIKSVFGFILDILPNIAKAMMASFEVVWQAFVQLALWAWDKIVALFASASDIGRLLWEGLKTAWIAFTEIGKWAWETVKAIFTGGDIPSLSETLFEDIPAATAEARANIDSALEGISANLDETKTLGEVLFKDIPAATADARAKLGAELDTIVAKSSDALSGLTTWAADVLGINVEAAEEIARNLIDKYSEFAEIKDEEATKDLVRQQTLMEELGILWEDYYNQRGTEIEAFAQNLFDIMQSTIDSVSNAVAGAIVSGQNLLQTFKAIAKEVLTQVIAVLVRLGIERLILNKLGIGVAIKETAAEMASTAAKGSANMLASQAGAPFPLNLSAPTMAAVTFGQISALGAKATGALAAGIAHGGLDYVPKESTYLLDKGERVLSPNQNRDFTDFINGGGGGGTPINVSTINVSVLPNATNADALLSMSPKDLEAVVAGPIIDALNALTRKGVKMEALERA